MIRLLTAVFLFACFHTVADDLRTFSDGQVIEADDFNHNFQKLEQDIANGVTGPQGEQGPAGPQGEKGDKGDTGDQGPAGADGADGVAAGLNCTTDQIIKWSGSAWVCSSTEIVSQTWDTPNGGAILCPVGKKVIGGGCRFAEFGDCDYLDDMPDLSANSAWLCRAYGGLACEVLEGFAICQ